MSITEENLKKMKLTMLTSLDKDLIDPEIDFSEEALFGDNMLLIRVKGYIYGEDGQKVTIEYPDGWFHAFKEKYFPYFLLKYLPVKYKIVTITPRTIYPNFRISMPNEKYKLLLIKDENKQIPKSDFI